MNRRSFLHRIGGAVAGLFIAPVVVKALVAATPELALTSSTVTTWGNLQTSASLSAASLQEAIAMLEAIPPVREIPYIMPPRWHRLYFGQE